MLPLISVNLPTFNRARFVAQAIDSVLRQTVTDWELNIVDNCSTDGTWDIISSYNDSRIRAYRNAENKGMVFSWNRLVELSRGQYVCYLASDDWFAPSRLEKLLKFLQENPECWGVCDYLVEVDENGNRSSQGHFETYFNRDIYNGDFHHALVNCINAEAIGLFKRAYFDEVGGFEEGLAFCDFRMHVRNLAKRLRIGSLPEQLHYKRQHGNSATSHMKDNLTCECFYLFKYVFNEIYLQDRDPTHLLAYIKWLLFGRSFHNVLPEERRRLLDYVTGAVFPFDTYATFHAYITQGIPVADERKQQEVAEYSRATKTAPAEPGREEMLRELVQFLVEKCMAYESQDITRLNHDIAHLTNRNPMSRVGRAVRKLMGRRK